MSEVKRVLILGGSWFLGRAIAAAAVAAGAHVTVFRRGVTGTDAAGVTPVTGDRADPDDLARLVRSGPWDAVIDTSSYLPAETLCLARALEPVVAHYVLVSTVAVYAGWPHEPLTEASPVLACPSDANRPLAYGEAKAGCERAVTRTFGPDRTTILRPGVILGPLEYVGRLAWWLRRMRRGGRVLAPGPPTRTIQPVDVRDVAAFALHTAATPGTWNLTSPGHDTMHDLLTSCNQVAAAGTAHLEWITDESWLQSHQISDWKQLPLWRPARGTWAVDSHSARTAGFHTRPLTATITDTWHWLTTGGAPITHPRATELGIPPSQEEAVLRAWDAHRSRPIRS
ncbi:NAD-dependent epimerase/dehydratase family protein [Spirillospora sp. CA-253888]